MQVDALHLNLLLTASMSALTDLTSMSGWIKGGGSADNFVNVASLLVLVIL